MKLRTSWFLLLAAGLLCLLAAESASGFYDPSVQRWINRDPAADRAGSPAHQFVDNSPIDHWDYLGLEIDPAKCEQMLSAAYESSRAANILSLLDQRGCAWPQSQCDCCPSYATVVPGAYFSSSDNSIHMCVTTIPSDPSQWSFTTLFVHELIHAVQHCYRFRPGGTCEDAACKEVQACANDGRCPAGPRQRECVIREAAKSAMLRSDCAPNAEQLVAAAYDQGCWRWPPPGPQ
jgi:hypothetical protein